LLTVVSLIFSLSLFVVVAGQFFSFFSRASNSRVDIVRHYVKEKRKEKMFVWNIFILFFSLLSLG
jgi:hypothetical protein